MDENKDRPAKDSQFVLLPCGNCKSEDVYYQHTVTGGSKQFRVKCGGCGQRTAWWGAKHNAQLDWNGRFAK